ncbi:MAG: hypothetical protein QOJ11_3025 [Frankiales bacterium]|jgi:hypothetical protein|nr:hypothetical protein [Frankiales bacterium]
MAASGWTEKPKTVSVRRSRRSVSPAETLWAVTSREDAALLAPYTALVIPVPDPGRRLSCVVDEWERRSQVRVVERLAVADPWRLVTEDLSTGVTTTAVVTQARSGSRVQLEMSCEAPRTAARARLYSFEAEVAAWLEQVTRVAEGFAELPEPRLEAVRAAGRLGPDTASIRGRRALRATRQEIWQLLTSPAVHPPESHRFWSGAGPVAVGHWLCTITEAAGRPAELQEVVEYVEGELLTLTTVAGGHHRTHTAWTLEDGAGGTLVSLDHECATSHVGLPPVVELALDRVAGLLGDR